MPTSLVTFSWESEVRAYETDFQGIVNNAVYYHYLDHTRCKHLAALGFDIKACADNHLNFVLIHSEIHYKHSLTVGDLFRVDSVLSRISALKYCFEQTIFCLNRDQLLMVAATSITCAVNALTGKPSRLNILDLPISSQPTK